MSTGAPKTAEFFFRRDRSFEKHEPDVLVRKKVISRD